MITTIFFQIYSFYATGSELGTRKQHFELRAFSGFCIRIFPLKLTLSVYCKKSVNSPFLELSTAPYGLLIFMIQNVYSRKFWLKLQRPQSYMWNVHIEYDHVWEVTILCSVTHQNLFYLCYKTYDTHWGRWINLQYRQNKIYYRDCISINRCAT